MESLKGCGVIYITSGAEFAIDACASAQSVREHVPGLQIDIYCDVPEQIPQGIFDQVHPIENPHKRSKVDYIDKSRFERVLYLDSDTRIIADVSDLFGLLDRFEICMCHAHSRERASTNQTWRTVIPRCFPQLNSGVFLFQNSPSVQEMFRKWAAAYHSANFNRDQVTLRELVWLSNLRLFVLPPEYNIRYAKYLEVWDDHEAHPKILHYPEYKSKESKKLKDVVKGFFGGRSRA